MNPTGITRVSPTGVVQPNWSNQSDSNGMAVDPTGKWLYTDETFTLSANVYRTEIAHPTNRTIVASLQDLGVPKGLDDLTIASSGKLYVTANLAGQVIRLDPITKKSCVIASGLTNTSAVKQGRGKALPPSRLYATGFDGKLLELMPPAGVTAVASAGSRFTHKKVSLTRRSETLSSMVAPTGFEPALPP